MTASRFTVAPPAPCEPVIEVCERLLVLAKSGDLLAVVACGVLTGSETLTLHAYDADVAISSIVGAGALVAARALKVAEVLQGGAP